PFAVGADFSMDVPVGDGDGELFKEQSLIEEKAYRDTWGLGTASYVAMLADRLAIMRELLRDGGTVVVHCDWDVGHHVRELMDEVFGAASFLNVIIWAYRRWTTRVSVLPRLHDNLFWYAKGTSYTFNQPMEVNANPNPSQYVSA